jgi:hypothetical protein
MSVHPNTLGLLDRAKRLIDESKPADESPLTTASRDIREARAAIAELIEAASALRGKRGAIMALGSQDARTVRFLAAIANVGGA